MDVIRALTLFGVAGLAEIGGGYLVWRWLRAGSGWWLGLAGGLVLFLYGILPTFQRAHFGRVYAAYGGVFVILSLLWGWLVDGRSPDRWDLVGAVVVSIGVGIIFFAPRTG